MDLSSIFGTRCLISVAHHNRIIIVSPSGRYLEDQGLLSPDDVYFVAMVGTQKKVWSGHESSARALGMLS